MLNEIEIFSKFILVSEAKWKRSNKVTILEFFVSRLLVQKAAKLGKIHSNPSLNNEETLKTPQLSKSR